MMATPRFEVQTSEKLGRHLVAAKDLRAGETILSDAPFVVGPDSDGALICFGCYRPVISKFLVCKQCAVAPVCPDDGCPDLLTKYHTKAECDKFRELKLSKGLHPMTMVQNVGSLTALRALLKKDSDPKGWEEFMRLETHLEERRDSPVWEFCENTTKFINSLGLLDGVPDQDFVQKICAIIDVNSFEVRGPLVPGIGCSEFLRGVYLKAALLAHDCTANTHMSINDNYLLICHASTDIKKGEPIYYNYTDPLKHWDSLFAAPWLSSEQGSLGSVSIESPWESSPRHLQFASQLDADVRSAILGLGPCVCAVRHRHIVDCVCMRRPLNTRREHTVIAEDYPGQ